VARQLDLFSSSPPSPDAPADVGLGPVEPRPGVVASRGSRAAETRLLAWLDALAAEARRDPSRLALPVRVVVPSRSLRRHVAARLVRPRLARPAAAPAPRAAMAGVIVQTLFGLAGEILERAGVAVPRGALLFETLVERAARGDDGLRRELGDLADGFLAVAPAVADLLDAGLEPEHAEAVDEALATDGPRAAGRAVTGRARAVVRVAVRAEARLRELGLERRSGWLRQATEALRTMAPEQVLPARAVLLHGFVAASGVAADLVAALLRQYGATLLLDRPSVPGVEEATEIAATVRLAERAAAAAALAPAVAGGRGAPEASATQAPRSSGTTGLSEAAGSMGTPEAPGMPEAPVAGDPLDGGAVSLSPPAAAAPQLEAFTAAGAEAEAREIARRLRRLLDGAEARADTAGAVGMAGAADAAGAVAAAGARRGGDARPEGLAVVARDFAPYRFALRRHLRRLGVPFSGVGERGGLLPAGRRAWAALDLLRSGPEAPADRWLDACDWLQAELRVDLRLALRALGAARLRDVAALRAETFDGGVALPVRQGVSVAAPDRGAAAEPPPDDDGEGRAVARSRRISGQKLRQGVLAAVRVHDRLLAWPRQAAAAVQMEWLQGLLGELGLDRDPAQPLAAALSELRREVPGELALNREELRLLLERALGDSGRCPLGGEGGGVQMLSVSEARGRTFDHLFLLGLNRDVFPRPSREDPLLPDDVRQVLQRLLPDLPLARESMDDERHAFAQLLSAAPAVTLSWRTADDDGKPLSASPLVERLLQPAGSGSRGARSAESPTAAAAGGPPWPGEDGPRGPMLAPRPAPALYPFRPSSFAGEVAAPAAGAGDADVRPADEHAVLAGLRGSRHELGLLLPLAVGQVREELGRPLLDLDPEAVAAARLRVLEELDPDPRTAAGRAAAARLGPFFGFVGPAASRGGHQLYVTHLEALAACPWQLFLGRLLRIERPADPLGALPGADPLRLGNLVHRALDRIVRRALAAAGAGSESDQGAAGTEPRQAAGAGTGREAGARSRREPGAQAAGGPWAAAMPPPVAVPWPAPEELEPLLTEAAAEVLAEEGLVLPGLAQALARHARPFVDEAGAVDWSAPGAAVPVCASEIDGELLLELPERAAGERRRLRFRADRADLVDGWLRFTDYKTGRQLSDAREPGRRRLQLLAEIRAGKRLQAVAYGIAAGGPRARGRYLFLRPGLADAAREVAVEAGDREARAAFAAAVGAVLDAWDAGSFFPRLVDPSGRREPSRCALCSVAEACLRGDPGARRRLHAWATRVHAGAPPAHPAEAAMVAAWDLPVAAGAAPGEDATAALDAEGEGG
jgi:PD-(D/E)XK nuclease superfamily